MKVPVFVPPQLCLFSIREPWIGDCKDRDIMNSPSNARRRPAVRITMNRAERLHRLVTFLAGAPRNRALILAELRIGLRTFYRELELLKRCGVRIQHRTKQYKLLGTADQAEGYLPFPDPQLSFAEMAELARCDCATGTRLAELLNAVTHHPDLPKEPQKRQKETSGGKKVKGRTKAKV